MRFGSREVCDIVLKDVKTLKPLVYIETMTMNSVQAETSTVYARGGKGFPKLIGWDGEKELRFENTDALISPESFALLSGANIRQGTQHVHQKDVLTLQNGLQFKLSPFSSETTAKLILNDALYTLQEDKYVKVTNGDIKESFNATGVTIESATYDSETLEIEIEFSDVTEGAAVEVDTEQIYLNKDGVAHGGQTLTYFEDTTSWGISYQDKTIKYGKLSKDAYVSDKFPLYIFKTDYGVDIAGELLYNDDYTLQDNRLIIISNDDALVGDRVIADYYFATQSSNKRLRITSDEFPKTFTLEAHTLWRDEDGYDHKARIRIPRAKLEGSFTIEMAPTGEPSTFPFNFECMKPKDGTDMLILDIDEDEIYTEFSKRGELDSVER